MRRERRGITFGGKHVVWRSKVDMNMLPSLTASTIGQVGQVEMSEFL